MKIINTPLEREGIARLKCADVVLFTGTIYTARDQAHRKMAVALKRGKRLPINLKDQIIYYCGPTKTPKGKIIGSCGPTTSSRMDEFTPLLLKSGLKGMIGKGKHSEAVRKAIAKHKAVYFLTYAGCGALLSRHVVSAKPVAYHGLGPEAIYKLEVKNFPLIVAIDYLGNNIYKEAST